MKRTYISKGIFIAVLMVVLPHTSSAYFTTAQSATKLNEQSVLYTITYAFGLSDQDIYMPVLAERGLAWKSSIHKLGYSLTVNGATSSSIGTAEGIVLSKAPIVNGMYKIAKGTGVSMTLLVLETTPKNTTKAAHALQVDQLPFYVDMGKKELKTRQLNPSELQYYVTKSVTLNKK